MPRPKNHQCAACIRLSDEQAKQREWKVRFVTIAVPTSVTVKLATVIADSLLIQFLRAGLFQVRRYKQTSFSLKEQIKSLSVAIKNDEKQINYPSLLVLSSYFHQDKKLSTRLHF